MNKLLTILIAAAICFMFSCSQSPSYSNSGEAQISQESKKFWDNEVLNRFKETPLENLPASIEESYRLLIVPPFNAPLSIRLWREGNKKLLVVKKTDGQGGFGIEKFGQLAYEKTRSLTEEEWDGYKKLLDKESFWNKSPLVKNEALVSDPTLLVIQGLKNKTFHEVHRRTPNEEFRESRNYLLDLSGSVNEYKDY